ncbi:DNA-directed primase/polymerase protein-like [Zingiber officinale]|uniref:DNA-directed primase/polymerase protein-like n=1 Tax=Zingiber officinale TaxID=94328 RepID=UPI001C4A9588|nr:DNA-directed primase/polymerase protein-like [Zingiber officinale]
MAYDPKDDVDRLFACFKCGVSTPESAVRERRLSVARLKATSGRGEAPEVSKPSSSKRSCKDSGEKEKHGAYMSAAIKLKSGKQISPIIFYGSPHGAPLKRPSRLLRLLHEIHVDLNEENDFISRKGVWATFPRQEEAIRFLKGHTQAKLFSYQDHLSGQRRFLASTYNEFWTRYIGMDSKLRHHYEVIQEGTPCHLYFDLEFDKKVNADKDVDEMVDILVSFTYDLLFDKYSIEGNNGWIIELDSSTSVKFSRHVIIRIPRVAFKDNSHVGAFVMEVYSRITSQRGSVPQVDKLYVKKDASSSDRQPFLDNAVYSRNRCFRLAFSSKAGKNSFLLPTERFKCKNMSKQDVFMESLICRMDCDCSKLLVCQIDADCRKTLCFDFEVQQQAQGVSQYAAFDVYRSDFPNTFTSGKSPFPALDAFVEYIASSGNALGKIRSWYWFSSHGLIVYSMLRSRYCERIGREHKSNHVMYVADLHRAVYYQKCYDPDCRGYRSPLRPLPHDVIPDNVPFLNSTEVTMTNINGDLGGSHLELYSNDNDKLVTESCMEENSWLQEAMKFADCVENSRNAPDFGILNEEAVEDCSWWMDVELLVSQVEEGLG